MCPLIFHLKDLEPLTGLEEAQYLVLKTLTGAKGNFDDIVHVHRGGMNRNGEQQQANSEKNETFH
jgi:hypothetical protein